MDRFPRRIVVVWGWVAASAILLPVCAAVVSREAAVPARERLSPGVVSETHARVRLASQYRGVSSASADSQVIPASHLFAPPPLPTVHDHLTGVPKDPGPPSGRGATVRMAPGIDAPGSDSPVLRRVPVVEDESDDVLRKLPPVEPGMLPPHTKLLRIDGSLTDGNDEDTMYLLPPVGNGEAISEPSSGATSAREQPDEIDVRRLPSPTGDDPQEVTAPSGDVQVRRLPSVAPDSQADVADTEPPNYQLDDLENLPPIESALNTGPLNTGQPTEPPPISPEMIPPDPLANDAALLTPDPSNDGPWVAVNPPPSTDEIVRPAPSADEALRPAQPVSAPQRLPAVERNVPDEHFTHEYSIQDNAALSALDRHVDAMARRAAELATRGAYFAARAEVLKALRAITQTLDAGAGTREHSDALGRAMRAFQEACDFTPRGSRLEADLDLALIVSGHRTPVLRCENLDRMTPVLAQQRYLQYAQEQFTVACERVPAASQALYALARIYTLMDQAKVETQTLCLPAAVALHQAALAVDPQNGQAANELGVLLANCGQLEEARRVLLQSVSVRPESTAWHNLSVVHERLGQSELARRASAQATTTVTEGGQQPSGVPVQSVHWVDPQVFSAAPSVLDP